MILTIAALLAGFSLGMVVMARIAKSVREEQS